MKNLWISILFVCLIPILANSQTETFTIGNTYTSDVIIHPFDQEYSYGLNLNGSMEVYSDTSLVRVILFGKLNNEVVEYLVYEGTTLFSPDGDSTLVSVSEETCLMNNVRLDSLKIEIINATITINTLVSDEVYKNNIEVLRKDSLEELLLKKITYINQRLTATKKAWHAGVNALDTLTYAQKRNLFAYGTKLPNLQGLEYYTDGYFSPFSDNSPTNPTANGLREFDWRNRHRANNYYMANGTTPNPYFDGDDTIRSGWITPRFTEQPGEDGSCWAMAPTYTLQSVLNLYYNHHINIDLSEQEMIYCSPGGGTCYGGGYPSNVLSYMVTDGIIDEACFPYTGCQGIGPQPLCADTCNVPQEKIKISGACFLESTKEALITKGPLSSFWPHQSISHAMCLIGYGIIKEWMMIYTNGQDTIPVLPGSPDIGKTYWIFEQSIGLWNNGTPFLNIIGNPGGYYIQTPLKSKNYDSTDIRCEDYDNDGYYNWGIGNKPSTCATGSPNQIDCNDADPTYGPYDEFYNCKYICDFAPYSETPILINNDTTWYTNMCLNRNVVVKYGKTLTIKSQINFVAEAGITVEPTAKLIVDGGILAGGIDNNRWQGIKVQGDYFEPQTQQYQGYVELKNGACLNDADVGIEAIYKVIIPENEPNEEILAGGIINANGANFGNNLIAISFKQYKNRDTINNLESNNVSVIHNCYFLNKDQANLENNPIFIRMQEVKGISVQNNIFEDKSNSTLLNHCNGIEAYDASFYVDRPDGTGSSLPIYSNKFNRLYYGIKALYTNSLLAPTIDYSIFDSCYRGVYISGNTSATITRNVFRVPHDSANCYGLYLDNSTGYLVEKNRFEGFGRTGGIGLIVNNSHEELNIIFMNTFVELYFGIIAQNDNRGYTDTTGLKIKCNIFNSGPKNQKDINVTSDNPFIPGGISYWQGAYIPNDTTSPASNIFSYSDSSYYEDIDNGCQNFIYFHNKFINGWNEPPISLVPRDMHYTATTISLDSCNGMLYVKNVSCNTTLGLGDYGELYAYMDYSSEEMNNALKKLQEFVDGGNTPLLQMQVENSPPSQALQLKNSLLGKSPYLSDTVLISTITNEDALPPLMLKQVLVANPQTPKSDKIMEKLENRVHPIPEYMIKEIEGGRNKLGEKEKLEAKLAYFYQEKELTFNEIVRRYKNDTLRLWAKDSLHSLLGRTQTPWAKYQLVFDKINEKKPDDAILLLEKIPVELNMNEYQLNNYNDFSDFVNLIVQLKKDSLGNYKISNAQKQILNSLSAKEKNYVSAYARNLLILVDSMEYNEPIILPQHQPGKIKKPVKIIYANEQLLKVFPNPAGNYFTVEYKLEEDYSNAIIEILDIRGVSLQKIIVTDKENQLVVETQNYKPGIYYIRLLFDNTVKSTIKISIIK